MHHTDKSIVLICFFIIIKVIFDINKGNMIIYRIKNSSKIRFTEQMVCSDPPPCPFLSLKILVVIMLVKWTKCILSVASPVLMSDIMDITCGTRNRPDMDSFRCCVYMFKGGGVDVYNEIYQDMDFYL